MKTILLTRNQVATVDDEDYDTLICHRWCALKYVRRNKIGYYAKRGVRKDGRTHTLYMHREILGLMGKVDGDHKDGDTLNNQRKNLRSATRKQTLQNRRKSLNRSSQLKGVSYNKRVSKWSAQIKTNGKKKHLGFFVDEEAAGRAFDKAAQRLFGTFALTNSL